MQWPNSDTDQLRALPKEPIATLTCGYGEVVSEQTFVRPIERTDNTPFGTISRFRFGKVSYTLFKLRGAQGRQILFHNSYADAVKLVYLLEGDCILCVGGIEVQEFHSGEHNSIVFPLDSMVSVEFTTQSDIALVVIGLERQLFLSHLPPSDMGYRALVNRVSWIGSGPINPMPLPITPDQFTVLYSIIDCKRQPFIRHHYINAKIKELLALHLEQWANHSSNSQVQGLREEELQRVYKVRDMLRQEPHKSYSLVGLAHAVGTNDATLKKQFKQVFGTTVFAYLTACRMELAKSLLLNNNKKVANVAQEVGYKYASHFSTAFRKYFGYLPTKLMRSIVTMPLGLWVGEPFL